MYDDMLRRGKKLFCIAADDCHLSHPDDHPDCDRYGGFVMIKSEKLEYKNIMEALEKDEVQLAAVGSLFSSRKAKVVGIYGACPFYCITGKQNEELMDQLNRALERIKIENPGLESELVEKYYNEGKISSKPLFTKE